MLREELVSLRNDDTWIESIADIHILSFAKFFLTQLGKPFLEVFYRAVLSHPNGIGVGICLNGKLVGFAIGSLQTEGFYKSLFVKNLFVFFKVIAPEIIRRPALIFKFINGLKGSGKYDLSDTQKRAVLLSVCVDPNIQGKAFGKKLLDAFELNCVELGYNEIVLSTEKYENDIVNKFYVRNDYKVVDVFEKDKSRIMNLYLKKEITLK